MVTDRLWDKKGVYREFQGDKYRYWPKRDFYVSQKGNRQRLLHREVYMHFNGEIPPKFEVARLDGDTENFTPTNLVAQKRNQDYHMYAKHPHVMFDGKRYYRSPKDEYYYHTLSCKTKKQMLHREIYRAYNGDPTGWDIHHIDHDKSNNHPSNLARISKSDHARHHAKTNTWVGSEENKAQLREAGKLAAAMHHRRREAAGL